MVFEKLDNSKKIYFIAEIVINQDGDLELAASIRDQVSQL